MKISIEYRNIFGKWIHYQTKHHEADAYRVASNRAKQTRMQHRLVDERGALLDLIDT